MTLHIFVSQTFERLLLFLKTISNVEKIFEGTRPGARVHLLCGRGGRVGRLHSQVRLEFKSIRSVEGVQDTKKVYYSDSKLCRAIYVLKECLSSDNFVKLLKLEKVLEFVKGQSTA